MTELLANGTELRVVFAAESIEEEIKKFGEDAVERFRHALIFAEKYNLHMRAYGYPSNNEELFTASCSLMFGRGSNSDVATFYVPRPSYDLSHICIAQANTPRATSRVELFERYWSASLSEVGTLDLIRKHIDGQASHVKARSTKAAL